jgi:hypothetical protein
MGILSFIFGASKQQQPAKPQASVPPNATRNATRRELIRVALRDTLVRNGVPTDWVAAEALSAITRGREPGLHLRLVMRQWQPELLAYAVALQKSVAQRVLLLDPLAATWLTGISWQLSPEDDTQCAALPAAGHWKRELPAEPAAPAAVPAQPALVHSERRAALERLMNNGHAPGRKGAEDHPEFSPTRPMFGFTQPGTL